MKTHEDNLLASRFAALAPEPAPGDWDEVLRRAGAALTSGRGLERSRDGRGSRRRLVAVLAAAALVLAVATATAFPAVREFVFEKGLLGLPPRGAIPTKSAELEFFYWVDAPPQLRRPSADPWKGHLASSRAWVYADGTLLWLREVNRPGGGGVDPLSTGFLEQRLTHKGVELLRSEVAAADGLGIFKGERHVSESAPEVRKRAVVRLSYPALWLPASAWMDRQAKPYVPSMFGVCVSAMGNDPIEPSRIVALLPEPAQALLRGRELGPFAPVPEAKNGGCVDMTTQEARSLAATLDAAGIERDTAPRLQYDLSPLTLSPIRRKAFVFFEPYLPDGEITCSACG
jgi:hypothetical protein